MNLEDSLLEAVRNVDYQTSSQVLLEVISKSESYNMASNLKPYVECEPDLRLRDHITDFLSLEPVYCAIEKPSYELLTVADGIQTREAAAQALFDFMTEIVESRDRSFNQQGVRIDRIASSHYVALAPVIIEQRTAEMEECRVPYTSSSVRGTEKAKYYIGDLLSTGYGGLINYAEARDYPDFVSETDWSKISGILDELGFNADSMLKRVEPHEWYEKTKELTKLRSSNLKSEVGHMACTEVLSLRTLTQAYHGLASTDSNRLKKSLVAIQRLQTKYCSRELLNLVEKASGDILRLSIEVLVDTHSPHIEAILRGLLNSKDQWKRTQAARGYSRMNALGTPSHPFNGNPIDAAGFVKSHSKAMLRMEGGKTILARLHKSNSPAVRRDIVRILAESAGFESEAMLLDLMNDPNETIRYEIVANVEKMPKELGLMLLSKALNDSSDLVSHKAQIITKRLDLGEDELTQHLKEF